MASFPTLVGALNRRGVRFVLIGVWGANFHARDASALFTTLGHDLSLVMTAFEFEAVWDERRVFLVEGEELPVARLSHIIRSKAPPTGRRTACSSPLTPRRYARCSMETKSEAACRSTVLRCRLRATDGGSPAAAGRVAGPIPRTAVVLA